MPFPPNVARFLIITVFRDIFRVGVQLLQAAVFQTQKGTFCFLWGQTRSCYAGPQRKHFNGHLNDFSIRKSVRNDEKSLSFNFFTLHNFKSSTTLRWGRDTWRSSKLPQAICKRTQHCWATTLNIVGCYMLCPFANLLHAVACCCAKFETGQTLSPVQTDATLLADKSQHYCWDLLRQFARKSVPTTSLTSINSTTPTTLKVMLHGTIRNDDFYRSTELQCWNNVVTIRNNAATLCCAKNRLCKSSRVTSPL